MILDFIKHLSTYFERLIGDYGFIKKNVINEEQSYSIEYGSDIFVIKLEKYRRELYATLYKIGSDRGINLFNLLSYLKQNSEDASKAQYFDSERDIESSYRKQLNHISKRECCQKWLVKSSEIEPGRGFQ